nr:PAS domain-containing protein [Aminivibrio sp.]
MSQTPSGQPGDKAGNSLEEQSALLEQLFNNAPLPIQRCSIEGQILRANQASEEVFGYTCEEMRGRFVDDLFAAPDTYDEAVKNTWDVLEGKTVFFEGRRRRKNGEAIYVKGTAFPIVLKGVQIGTYSIYTDQTAVQDAEIRLRQSEERYRSLVDDIPAMICAFDDRGILSFVNREFCTFFSLPAE